MNKRNEKKDEEILTDAETGAQPSNFVEKINELEQKLEEAELKYKRALADYQNLQKRSEDARVELVRTANKDLLLRILTVLDTLILANQHVQDKNLQVSINHFLDILKAEGVTQIKTEGESFDPYIMECVTTEKGKQNKVLHETRAGFLLNDKVLRPAQVIVGEE